MPPPQEVLSGSPREPARRTGAGQYSHWAPPSPPPRGTSRAEGRPRPWAPARSALPVCLRVGPRHRTQWALLAGRTVTLGQGRGTGLHQPPSRSVQQRFSGWPQRVVVSFYKAEKGSSKTDTRQAPVLWQGWNCVRVQPKPHTACLRRRPRPWLPLFPRPVSRQGARFLYCSVAPGSGQQRPQAGPVLSRGRPAARAALMGQGRASALFSLQGLCNTKTDSHTHIVP